MWLLAESWGRVTQAGIRLPLGLTHDVLGALVGARRPTVTLALRELTERGAILIDGVEIGEGSFTMTDAVELLPSPPLVPSTTSAEPPPRNGQRERSALSVIWDALVRYVTGSP